MGAHRTAIAGVLEPWLSGLFDRDRPYALAATERVGGYAVEIYYRLEAIGGWAYGGSGGTADFGATGAIGFALPAGVSLTSDGGYSPVPEPATMLLAGAGLAAAIRRKARG